MSGKASRRDRRRIAQDNPEGASQGRSPGKAASKTTIEARGPQGREPDCARNRRDRVAKDSADDGPATAPVDALPAVPALLPGPQNPEPLPQAQGRLGGTLNLIRSRVRPGRAAMFCNQGTTSVVPQEPDNKGPGFSPCHPDVGRARRGSRAPGESPSTAESRDRTSPRRGSVRPFWFHRR